MGFRLTPRSMTLDDLELHKFEFSVNFAGFRRFISDATTPIRMKMASIVSDDVVSTLNWSNFWQAVVSRGFVSDSWAFLFSNPLSFYLGQLTQSSKFCKVSDCN